MRHEAWQTCNETCLVSTSSRVMILVKGLRVRKSMASSPSFLSLMKSFDPKRRGSIWTQRPGISLSKRSAFSSSIQHGVLIHTHTVRTFNSGHCARQETLEDKFRVQKSKSRAADSPLPLPLSPARGAKVVCCGKTRSSSASSLPSTSSSSSSS
ncbi:hypothetical protein IF1G_08611 [Cordyceps javanica]|uniref:Uncharacterized protein n=1 Tax=Cordyceps javanica TaxID=43265 RepID=A0A545UTA0_9HYPO|nr:hypothetical protein IF1G_08611 [Cordyceps javanica]TQW03353.1 hypothetical protein IF2G_09082 [Cordyceps javanica]